jgi:hypothetical protein
MKSEEKPLEAHSMEQETRVINGPVAPPEGLSLQPSYYRPIFAVYLEMGMIVTRSEGFAESH